MVPQGFAIRSTLLVLLCCALLGGVSSALARQPANTGSAYLVKEIGPGPWDGVMNINGASAGLLFFRGRDADLYTNDWISDGTEAGTVLNTLGPNGSVIYPDTNARGDWFFSADDGVHGRELWMRPVDGTMRMVKDIAVGASSSAPGPSLELNDRMLFIADDGIHGQELWATDGTEAGTYLVKDINPGPGDFEAFDLFGVGNKVLFWAKDGFGDYEPWVSDGTPSGTYLLKDINPGSAGSYVARVVSNGSRAFFSLTPPDNDTSFWTSDGTAEGTLMLKAGDGSITFDIGVGQHRTYFTQGSELWITDGTPANTKLITAITDHAVPHYLTIVNDRLFFAAQTLEYGEEAWISDGTAEGTHMLKDIVPGPYGSDPLRFIDVNGTLVLRARGLLWQSDGTADGTVPLTDDSITPGYTYRVANSRLFFEAKNDEHGNELWAIPLSALTKKVTSPVPPLPTTLPTPPTTPPTPTMPITPQPPQFSHFLPLMQSR